LGLDDHDGIAVGLRNYGLPELADGFSFLESGRDKHESFMETDKTRDDPHSKAGSEVRTKNDSGHCRLSHVLVIRSVPKAG
jgi:hypothetical protein